MKKLLMFVLLVTGWGLVLYLVHNPTVRWVYCYYPKMDFGESYRVALGDGEEIIFRKGIDRCSNEVWKSEREITLKQFDQYRLNHLEYMHCRDSDNLGTNSLATMVALDDANGFCKWLNWRESQKGQLPYGYCFSVVKPDDYNGYVDIGDKTHLIHGFPIRLGAKRQDVEQPLIAKKSEAAKIWGWKIVCDHPIFSSFLLVAFLLSRTSLFGKKGNNMATAET